VLFRSAIFAGWAVIQIRTASPKPYN